MTFTEWKSGTEVDTLNILTETRFDCVVLLENNNMYKNKIDICPCGPWKLIKGLFDFKKSHPKNGFALENDCLPPAVNLPQLSEWLWEVSLLFLLMACCLFCHFALNITVTCLYIGVSAVIFSNNPMVAGDGVVCCHRQQKRFRIST